VLCGAIMERLAYFCLYRLMVLTIGDTCSIIRKQKLARFFFSANPENLEEVAVCGLPGVAGCC